MKKYIYLVMDDTNKVIAAYDRLDLVNKLRPHIEKKLEKELTVSKVQVNVDLKQIDG
jgi:hypothetical protein